MLKSLRTIFLLSILLIIVFLLSACKITNDSHSSNAILKNDSTNDVDSNFNFQENTMNLTNEQLILQLKKVTQNLKSLDSIPNIDKTIIKVNGEKISRRAYEIAKITSNYNENDKEKNALTDLIKNCIIKSEAKRLNITPNQKDIDDFIQLTKENICNNPDSIEKIYIDEMGISLDEYLSELETNAYNLYQKNTLCQYVENNSKVEDFDVYINNLGKKANIQFLDSKIKKIYYSDN